MVAVDGFIDEPRPTIATDELVASLARLLVCLHVAREYVLRTERLPAQSALKVTPPLVNLCYTTNKYVSKMNSGVFRRRKTT